MEKPQIITTRDRIRLLMETNQIIPKSRFQDTGLSVAPAAELLDLAQSRFSWLRTKLFQQWNPDYSEDPKQISDGDNRLGVKRQYKPVLLIMDTRWWVWNVLFALLPAIVITLYCELRGKRLMYDYHRRQELAQLKLILGDDEFTVERGNAIIDARNRAMKENKVYDIDDQVLNYIISVCSNVFNNLYSFMYQQWQELFLENNQDEDGKSPVPIKKNTGVDVEPAKNIPPLPVEVPLKPGPPVTSLPQLSGIQVHEPLSSQQGSVHPPIEDLLLRVQQLEHRLHTQEHSLLQQRQDEEIDDAEAIRLIGQRMKRLDQSNVQNRFEMEFKEKWKRYLNVGTAEEDKSPTANTAMEVPSAKRNAVDHTKPSNNIEGTVPSSFSLDDIFNQLISPLLRVIGLCPIDNDKQPDDSDDTKTLAVDDVVVVASPIHRSTVRNKDHTDNTDPQHHSDVKNVSSRHLPSRPLDSESEVPGSNDSPNPPWWRRFWN